MTKVIKGMKKIVVGWTDIDIDGTVYVFNWDAYIIKDDCGCGADLAVIIDYDSTHENESVTLARVELAEDGRYIPQRGGSFIIGHDDMDTVLERMSTADNPLDLLIAALAV